MAKVTIDNLGPEVSTRYAEDQKLLEESNAIKGASAVLPLVRTDVSVPYRSGGLEELVNSAPTQIPWASFTMPKGFETAGKIFSFQTAPSVGSIEKRDSQTETAKKRLPSQSQKAIISLLDALKDLDRLVDIGKAKVREYMRQ